MTRSAWFRASLLVTVIGAIASGGFLAGSYRDYQNAGEAIAEHRQKMVSEKEVFDRTGVYAITPEMRTSAIRDAERWRETANEEAGISQIALMLSIILPFTLYFTISWITTGSLKTKNHT